MLVCLCNREGVAPPRAVVRIGKGKGAELAISLPAPEADGFRSCLLRFARIEVGEGIEKKEENFADEVMKQVEEAKKKEAEAQG